MGIICPEPGYMACIVRCQPCVKQNSPACPCPPHPVPNAQDSRTPATFIRACLSRQRCISKYFKNFGGLSITFVGTLGKI